MVFGSKSLYDWVDENPSISDTGGQLDYLTGAAMSRGVKHLSA